MTELKNVRPEIECLFWKSIKELLVELEKLKIKDRKMKPKPLNFEKARSEIRKEVLEWLYKDIKQPDEYLVSLAIAHAVRKSFERVKSACEFYLRYKDSPELLRIEQEIEPPEQFREYYAESKIKNVSVVSWDLEKYNGWLFRLAFGLREDEDENE